MDTRLYIAGHTGIYSDTPPSAADEVANPVRCVIRLSVERSPMALSRVFGLIGTLAIIPELSRMTIGKDDVIDVVLEFSYIQPHKLDLLCRKLIQLTETTQFCVAPSERQPDKASEPESNSCVSTTAIT